MLGRNFYVDCIPDSSYFLFLTRIKSSRGNSMKQIEFEYWALSRSLYRGSIHAVAALIPTYNLLPQAWRWDVVIFLLFRDGCTCIELRTPPSIHSIDIVGCCNQEVALSVRS